jgi:hypothetical protein
MVAVPLLVGALFLGMRRQPVAEPVLAAQGPPLPRQTKGETSATLPASMHAAETSPGAAPVDAQMVAHLRERYGAHIDNPYVQMQMLEQLMRYYQKRDPEHWKERLLDAVRAAFPERYDEIAKTLEGRLAYERWMKENRARLDGLDPKARRAEIWEERKRLFGEEAAEKIWASEMENQGVEDALQELDAKQGQALGDKLAAYKQRLSDIYEEKYDSYLENHRHEAMNRFLSLESVQAELDGMSPQARSESLREIRKGMGLDDAALARWDTLDKERDARWEAGAKYMLEREALSQKYEGDELDQKLGELRSRYFGKEAEVIASEEQSGLYRFARPRRWGQN